MKPRTILLILIISLVLGCTKPQGAQTTTTSLKTTTTTTASITSTTTTSTTLKKTFIEDTYENSTFISDCMKLMENQRPPDEKLMILCTLSNAIGQDNTSICVGGEMGIDEAYCMQYIISGNDRDTERCREYAYKFVNHTGWLEDCVTQVAAKTGNESHCNGLFNYSKDKCVSYAKKDTSFCRRKCRLTQGRTVCESLSGQTILPENKVKVEIDKCIIDMVSKTGSHRLCRDLRNPVAREACLNAACLHGNDTSQCMKTDSKDQCLLTYSILSRENHCLEMADGKLKESCLMFFN